MLPGLNLDQLGGDAHSISGLSDAAFQDKPYPQVLAHLAQIHLLALVRERGGAGDHQQAGQLGKVGDDVLADAVAEIILLRVPTHVVKSQHRDGGFFHQGGRFGTALGFVAFPRFIRSLQQYTVNPHRPGDIFDRLSTEIFEGKRQAGGHLFVNAARDADAARFGQGFQPGRDVHAVAENVAPFLQHIPQIHPDPKSHAAVFRLLRAASGQRMLDFHRAIYRVHHRSELRQHGVAMRVDDAPPVP